MAKTKRFEFVMIGNRPWYNGPKSFCSCGHLGDGAESDHANPYGSDDGTPGMGHGGCGHVGCDCRMFTWTDFTPQFRADVARKTGLVPT